MARLKIYTDENVDVRVAEGLRRRGVEAVSVYDEATVGLSDEAHDGSIKLPQEMIGFSGFDRTSSLDGRRHDCSQPLKPSQFAERVSEKEMPLKEVATEVHQMRREARKRRGQGPTDCPELKLRAKKTLMLMERLFARRTDEN